MKTSVRRCALSILCVLTLIIICNYHASAQNNLCGNAIVLNSAPACYTTAGTLVGATYTAASVTAGCGTTNRNDVWYSFVANSVNPIITLGGTLTSNQPCLQLYSDCSGTLAPGTNCVTNSSNLTASALVPGNTYLIRVFSGNNTAATFTICVRDQYDVCASAVTLTSSTTCVNTPGNIYGATTSTTTISAPNCVSGTVTRDVWYKFVAQTVDPTITISGLGASFTNPGIQLLSNNCGGTFTSLFCGTTSIAADNLVPGTTYFVRVYSTTVAAPASPNVADFNICIQDPVAPTPFNDECANAINLPIWNTCNSVGGDMGGATASSTPLGACTGPNAYDVWYKFTAINSTATITLGSIGTNFLNPRIQMFSGSCGSLTSIFCGTSPLAATGLTAGNTYYVRVYSTTAPAPNGNAGFTICATTTNAPIRFGNSYVNITKKTTGGVVEPGDILEIRMTINHTSGTMYRMRFLDNVPSNTQMITAAGNFIGTITNEGLRYKQFTPTADADAATYIASPPAGQYQIRMNLAFGASTTGAPPDNTPTNITNTTGQMTSSDRPVGGGGLLFAVAYRVRVTGNVGDTITLNPAQFIYRTSLAGTDIPLVATPFKILISTPLTLCTNSIGVNNAAEFGGTFGSGTTDNRTTDLATPIAGYSFVPNVNANNAVGDGRYALVKNLSPRNSTLSTARRQPNCTVAPTLGPNDINNCANRMFGGFWYIDGDHTGTNNAAGNAPPSSGSNASYMLMVNADYVASEIYRQSITNLCPNTYYEFSAWVKNICPTCGIDSTGAQFAGTATAPAGGYPGVYPNLSFLLNDVDYYNTGEIDTLGWQKRGFVFRTGPSQTSATFSIRNNSQGGGGNDWALDDIAVATCLPTMSYSPTINPNVCTGNAITIRDTISSFFRNYTTYKWQRSTNGGASWTDITGVTTLADTNYYITSYTVPPANTTLADSGDLYRVVVATTAANLSDPNCNISDGVTITLSVTNCGIPLKTDLLNFNGRLVVDKGHLSWTTSKEDEPFTFTVEKSLDGINFVPIGTVNSHQHYAAETNTYSFVDPVPLNPRAFYRITMKAASGGSKLSRTIPLNKAGTSIGLVNVINPFNQSLDFDIAVQGDGKIETELVDIFGKIVLKKTYTVHSGINALSLTNTEVLPAGTYILRIRNNEVLINRKVLKKSF